MEVSVERMVHNADDRRTKGKYEDFTVFINDKRILSFFAYDDLMANNWISEVRKSFRNKKFPLVAGVSVDRDIRYRKGGVRDNPYETLTLCVGSHCLVYTLPDCEWMDGEYLRSEKTNKVLRDFLADRNVIFVAMDAGEVNQRLERFHSMKMVRSGDVRALAVKLHKDERGLVRGKPPKSLTLDDAAKVLLDKRMDVDRPEWKPERTSCYLDYQLWKKTNIRRYVNEVNDEYMQFQTLDAFYCHEIGVKYLEELKKL